MNRLKRTVFAFAAVTLFVAIAGAIYLHFGRGVSSDYMGHAYFYPLFLGVLFNALLLIIQRFLPFTGTVGYRLYSNVYNSGIAFLTVYSVISGVFEIAGTDSNLTAILRILGWCAIVVGILVLCLLLVNVKSAQLRRGRNRRRYR